MSFDMFPDSAIEYLLKEDSMAQHEEPYTRYEGEGGTLDRTCGHHCGVITVGGNDQHVGHCHKPCCHGDEGVSAVMEQPMNEGVNLGGIR